MGSYILSGVVLLVAISIFTVLVLRQMRWSHPAKGRGPGYVEDPRDARVPDSVRNPPVSGGG